MQYSVNVQMEFFSLPFWLQVTTTIMRIDARALTHSHADRVSERKSKHEMAKVASKYRRYGDEMRSASERDTTCSVCTKTASV